MLVCAQGNCRLSEFVSVCVGTGVAVTVCACLCPGNVCDQGNCRNQLLSHAPRQQGRLDITKNIYIEIFITKNIYIEIFGLRHIITICVCLCPEKLCETVEISSYHTLHAPRQQGRCPGLVSHARRQKGRRILLLCEPGHACRLFNLQNNSKH